MLAAILKLIGIGLPAIVAEITKERTKQLDAKTEQERIAADERIKALEAKKDVVIESYKDRGNNIMRHLWAIPFLLYTWKLLVWDKLLGWGVTDPLSPTLEYILWTVLGGYFITVLKR